MTAMDTPIDSETIKADSKCENSFGVKSWQPFLKVKNQSGTEDIHYSVIYDSLPPEFEAVAERELKEMPSSREDGLCDLKAYMKRKNIPMLNEHLLLAVLRNCKFDVKKSEKKLIKFINTRKDFIKELHTLRMETIENIIDDMVFGMWHYRDKHGRVIFYTRPSAGRWDIYSISDVAIVYLVTTLFALSFPLTTVSGLAYFGDCTTYDLYLFKDIFSAFRKHIFTLLSLPIRLARLEVLNENYMCHIFFSFMKTLLSKKVTERVSLHGSNFDNFLQMYSPDVLPEEFGGKLGPLSNEVYREKLLDFIKDLRNQNP